MRVWPLHIPIIAGFTGWLVNSLAVRLLFYPLHPVKIFGVALQGIIIKRKSELAPFVGKVVSEKLFSFAHVEQLSAGKENLKHIMPEVEGHIDHFLRVKLKQAMPVAGMFVGEKTISQLKEVFMAELQLLFPVIMKKYFTGLQNNHAVEHLVTETLANLSPEKLRSKVQPVIFRELRLIALAGAAAGFVTGVIVMMMLFFIR